jgi:acyl-CoA synthetase (AMP-forming)/AMP-acid ligase II
MTMTPSTWGDEIVVETIGAVPFRRYAQRPRRVEELLIFTARWGDRPHVIQGDAVLTFDGLHRAASDKARVLTELGLGQGDRVLVLGWNGPAWIVNFWGVLAAGGVPVLGNAWWSETELLDSLAEVRPSLTLADARSAARMPTEAVLAPWEIDPEAPNAMIRPVSDDEEAPAVIIFTSGSGGKAKAVELAHRSLLAGLQMLLHVTRRLPHQVDETSRDIGLHTGPLFHIGGIQTLLRSMVVGGALVMPRGRFDPAEALELIESYRIGRWSAVPTMITRLLDHPDVHTRDLSSLKSLTAGGAPIHSELYQRMRTGMPGVEPKIATGYGLSENGGQATAASAYDTAAKPGSSGKPLPCVELRLKPREGLPDAEILIRAPTQMLGYIGGPDSPIDAEGWLETGDLGRIDEDGHLWLTGRSKDVIIRGGENIAPAAVERALVATPGVVEALVFGLPHADLGEEVMAIVVVEPGRDVAGIKTDLQGRLSSFAIPSRWRLQTERLPLNHAGKVDKAALVAGARAEQAAEQGA